MEENRKVIYAENKADDGNRTRLSSLGSLHSTDELHLRIYI